VLANEWKFVLEFTLFLNVDLQNKRIKPIEHLSQ